jgi:hypothetical protein
VPSSTERMRTTQREIRFAALGWFVWGISMAVGKQFQIDWFRPEKDSGLLWLIVGGFMVLGIFVGNCTEAILARIDEKAKPVTEE